MVAVTTAASAFAAFAPTDQSEKGIWGGWNKPADKIKYGRSAGKGKNNSGALRPVMLKENPAGLSGMFLKTKEE